MQFMKEDQMPTEDEIQKEIESQLFKTIQAFEDFKKSCEQSRDIVIDAEDGIESELVGLESNLISELQGNYSRI